MLPLLGIDQHPPDRLKEIIEHLQEPLLLLGVLKEVVEDLEEELDVDGGDPDAAFGAFDPQKGEGALQEGLQEALLPHLLALRPKRCCQRPHPSAQLQHVLLIYGFFVVFGLGVVLEDGADAADLHDHVLVLPLEVGFVLLFLLLDVLHQVLLLLVLIPLHHSLVNISNLCLDSLEDLGVVHLALVVVFNELHVLLHLHREVLLVLILQLVPLVPLPAQHVHCLDLLLQTLEIRLVRLPVLLENHTLLQLCFLCHQIRIIFLLIEMLFLFELLFFLLEVLGELGKVLVRTTLLVQCFDWLPTFERLYVFLADLFQPFVLLDWL
mmetsp:Transcript_22082/g.21280  ORF Transcript_22082/g.21280 Transcript_22082/m.21280 type:complete len:323 (-) Transcript_22082:149-1117(-)